MRQFSIKPLTGVGPVTFGSSRESVRDALAEPYHSFRKSPRSEHETDAFDTLGFHIYYQGDSPKVKFIELFHCESSVFRYKKTDIFRTKADDLFKMLEGEAEWYNDVGSFIFPALQIALYRSRPHDPDNDDFDRWEAFAVGRPGYYSEEPPERAVRPPVPPRNPFAQ